MSSSLLKPPAPFTLRARSVAFPDQPSSSSSSSSDDDDDDAHVLDDEEDDDDDEREVTPGQIRGSMFAYDACGGTLWLLGES